MLIKTSMHLIEGNLGHISPAKVRYMKGEANSPTMVVGARENGAFELTSAVDHFASFFFHTSDKQQIDSCLLMYHKGHTSRHTSST